jgi:SAM-dependent methyltransferase
MEWPDWAPPGVDTERPSVARMWDYLLGGAHNFAIDRQVAEQAIKIKPDIPELVRQARAFMHRAIEFLTSMGVDQFLDIGSGLPTRGNVHEKAQQLNPAAKVVYVDHDPVAIAHGRAILKDNDRVAAIVGDLRDPKAILANPTLRSLIDFDRPVGLLLVGVLHFVFDEYDPKGIVAILRDVLAPGSYLTLQHATTDQQPASTIELVRFINANSPEPMHWRTRDEISEFFDGFTLVDPGIVFEPQWRTEPSDDGPQVERSTAYAAVGRKD